MAEEIEKFPFMAEYVLSTLKALVENENSLFGDQPKL